MVRHTSIVVMDRALTSFVQASSILTVIEN